MTLEELLRTKVKSYSAVMEKEVEVSPSFIVDVMHEREDGVHFIIHPFNNNGETLDFVVKGNELKPL